MNRMVKSCVQFQSYSYLKINILGRLICETVYYINGKIEIGTWAVTGAIP